MNMINKYVNSIKANSFHFDKYDESSKIKYEDDIVTKNNIVNNINLIDISFSAPSDGVEHAIHVCSDSTESFKNVLLYPEQTIYVLDFKKYGPKNKHFLPPFMRYCYGLRALGYYSNFGYRIMFLTKNKTSPICLSSVFWLHFFLERYKSDPKVDFYLTYVFPFNYYFKEYKTINDYALQNWIYLPDSELLNPYICPQISNISLSDLGFTDLSRFLDYEYVIPESFFIYLQGNEEDYTEYFTTVGTVPPYSALKNPMFNFLSAISSPIKNSKIFNNWTDDICEQNYYFETEININRPNPFLSKNFFYYIMHCNGLIPVEFECPITSV